MLHGSNFEKDEVVNLDFISVSCLLPLESHDAGVAVQPSIALSTLLRSFYPGRDLVSGTKTMSTFICCIF